MSGTIIIISLACLASLAVAVHILPMSGPPVTTAMDFAGYNRHSADCRGNDLADAQQTHSCASVSVERCHALCEANPDCSGFQFIEADYDLCCPKKGVCTEGELVAHDAPGYSYYVKHRKTPDPPRRITGFCAKHAYSENCTTRTTDQCLEDCRLRDDCESFQYVAESSSGLCCLRKGVCGESEILLTDDRFEYYILPEHDTH